ncbi:MAG: YihY family inner membrane protein [Geopsychrobacter sp.]|nr:YihY family inner membrane protein [Geopsychrobacter sp.]
MAKIRQRWHCLLWEQDVSQLNYAQVFLLRQLQTASLVIHDFLQDRCMLRASALTYTSLLAIVPLLALTFALLKAFGVQNSLEPLILEKLNVGSHEVVGSILTYVNNTQVGKLGVFGLLFLLIAVISLLSNIEDSFNHVWGVKGLRPLIRRFSDYLSVLLVGPVLLISAISMTSSLTSHQLVQRLIDMEVVGSIILTLFKMGPYLLMWIAFAVLYVFMSNTRVEWSSAFAGGILGGTLWQLAQWSYINFQVGVAKYNAIYGTMAALPIFMIWVYISWNIVLLGLEFTYARQNLRTGGRDLHGYEVNRNSYERVALILLVTLGRRFYRALEPVSKEALSQKIGIPPRLCEHLLLELVILGFVSEVCVGNKNLRRYQLGRSAESLILGDIVRGLRGHGEEVLHLRQLPEVNIASTVLARLEQLDESSGVDLSLKELIDQVADD